VQLLAQILQLLESYTTNEDREFEQSGSTQSASPRDVPRLPQNCSRGIRVIFVPHNQADAGGIRFIAARRPRTTLRMLVLQPQQAAISAAPAVSGQSAQLIDSFS
jgi:hypothetical protein